MQISLENQLGLERKLNVRVAAEQVEGKVKIELNKIAAKVKIPGFRPGKVPFAIVQKRYAESARLEVLEDLIRETYTEAIKKNNLEPAGMPNIKIVQSKPGEPFVYDAIFEVFPKVKVEDLNKIEVEKITAKVTDEDVNETLEKMRKNRAKWQEVEVTERKSQIGDQLLVDFTVKPCEADREDKALEPKTEKDVKFVLGDGSMWADFEQPLYGVSAGEEKSYNLQFPAEHIDKGLAGKRVNFVVKIHKVCEPILPELNDEFARSMVKDGDLEHLRAEIRTHMENDLQGLLRRVFKDEVLDRLLDCNPIEVPKVLVENELKRLAAERQRRFSQSEKNSFKKIPSFSRDDFAAQAKRTVSLRLLLSEVIKEHNLMVEPQEVRKKIEDLVAVYYESTGDKEKMINKYLSDHQHVAEIESLLLEEKVISYLEAKISIKEKMVNYKEAMAKRK